MKTIGRVLLALIGWQVVSGVLGRRPTGQGRLLPNMHCPILLRTVLFVAAAMWISSRSANAQVVPGAMLHYNAAFNSLVDTYMWENLGTEPNADLVVTEPDDALPVHTFNAEFDVSYYSFPTSESGSETGDAFRLPDGKTLDLFEKSFTAEIWARMTRHFVGRSKDERQIFGLNAGSYNDQGNRVRVSTANINPNPITAGHKKFVDIIYNANPGRDGSIYDVNVGNQAGPVDLGSEEWYQLTFTLDYPTKTLNFYAHSDDPVLTGDAWRHSITHDNFVDMTDTHLVLFMSGEDPDDARWPGDISIFRLYDRALTPEEIQQNFESGNANAGNPPPLPPPPPPALTDFEWQSADSGDWNENSNWDGGPPGNQADLLSSRHTATFGDAIGSASRTVVTDTAVTVNSISFTNTMGGRYTIAGGPSMNLNTSTNGTAPSLAVSGGSHQFQVPVAVDANTIANIAGGGTLTFNNALDLTGNTLTKTGTGTLDINNVLTTGGGSVINQQGILSGVGTIEGDVINDGTLSPGGSAGSTSVVPEPTTMFLALIGLAGLLGLLRRRT